MLKKELSDPKATIFLLIFCRIMMVGGRGDVATDPGSFQATMVGGISQLIGQESTQGDAHISRAGC